jgi:aryl-alcohol dehydrogenase-like predicted oxidoreductase
VYRNEVEAGTAIRQYNRDEVYVTTKVRYLPTVATQRAYADARAQWSGLNGLSAEESIHNSLKYVRRPSCPSRPPSSD